MRVFEFIESATFEKFLPYYLDDDEYSELQQFMMRHPEAGRVSARIGRRAKTPLAARRGGKAWWFAGDLLRTVPAEPVLDAYALCEGEAREHPGPRSRTTEGGIRA